MKNYKSKNKEIEPNNRLIVHNLDYATTKESLAEFFSKYGNVLETEVPMNERYQKSKGFGFVTFSSVEEATKANNEEDEKIIDGRKVRTSFAKKREKTVVKGKKLYIGKLPWQINEEELKEYFEKFGTVEDAFLSTLKYASYVDGYPQHKGFGFVTFVNEEDANAAVRFKNHNIKGTYLSVRKAKPQDDQKGGRDKKSRKEDDRKGKKKDPLVVKKKSTEETNNKQDKPKGAEKKDKPKGSEKPKGAEKNEKPKGAEKNEKPKGNNKNKEQGVEHKEKPKNNQQKNNNENPKSSEKPKSNVNNNKPKTTENNKKEASEKKVENKKNESTQKKEVKVEKKEVKVEKKEVKVEKKEVKVEKKEPVKKIEVKKQTKPVSKESEEKSAENPKQNQSEQNKPVQKENKPKKQPAKQSKPNPVVFTKPSENPWKLNTNSDLAEGSTDYPSLAKKKKKSNKSSGKGKEEAN